MRWRDNDIHQERIAKALAEARIAIIAREVATQDNHCTKDVYFVVQEQVRDYGFDPEWGGECVWVDGEGLEVPEDEILISLDHGAADAHEELGLTLTGYKDRWEFRQAFLTSAAAEEYVRTQAHRHSGALRVYGESAHRNPEIQTLRDHLLGLAKEAGYA